VRCYINLFGSPVIALTLGYLAMTEMGLEAVGVQAPYRLHYSRISQVFLLHLSDL